MSELIERYETLFSVSAPLEEIKEIIANLEDIKIWGPSHGLPFVTQNWISDEGGLQPENLLTIKSDPSHLRRGIDLCTFSVRQSDSATVRQTNGRAVAQSHYAGHYFKCIFRVEG